MAREKGKNKCVVMAVVSEQATGGGDCGIRLFSLQLLSGGCGLSCCRRRCQHVPPCSPPGRLLGVAPPSPSGRPDGTEASLYSLGSAARRDGSLPLQRRVRVAGLLQTQSHSLSLSLQLRVLPGGGHEEGEWGGGAPPLPGPRGRDRHPPTL